MPRFGLSRIIFYNQNTEFADHQTHWFLTNLGSFSKGIKPQSRGSVKSNGRLKYGGFHSHESTPSENWMVYFMAFYMPWKKWTKNRQEATSLHFFGSPVKCCCIILVTLLRKKITWIPKSCRLNCVKIPLLSLLSHEFPNSWWWNPSFCWSKSLLNLSWQGPKYHHPPGCPDHMSCRSWAWTCTCPFACRMEEARS